MSIVKDRGNQSNRYIQNFHKTIAGILVFSSLGSSLVITSSWPFSSSLNLNYSKLKPTVNHRTSSLQVESSDFNHDESLKFSPIKNTNDRTYSSSSTNHEKSTRRQILKSMSAITTTSILISTTTSIPQSAKAAKAEIDTKTGELFSPREQMIGGGGSDAARGVKLESRGMSRGILKKESGLPLQNVYETRFIAYLSRFLLHYDPAASSWWSQQKFQLDDDDNRSRRGDNGKSSLNSEQSLRFAEFAESVEIGLCDYFCGPYGSYASVEAAKAGLNAAVPATASTTIGSRNTGFKFTNLFKGFLNDYSKTTNQQISTISTQKIDANERKKYKQARQGVLNLFSLLKARYISSEEKYQLAILFSLISNPYLQPTSAIQGLIGEADNATITGIELDGLLGDNKFDFRSSSHHGGGYSFQDNPTVTIDAPPSLGDNYKPAEIIPIMNITTRILRLTVLDGGSGYSSIPSVRVIQDGVKVPCEACAILDREGSVESIVVLNPGLGYGGFNPLNPISPKVEISPPKKKKGDNIDDTTLKTATAQADLEYAITKLQLMDGGNGYIFSQPPNINISPPSEDPDWYVTAIDQKTWTPLNDSNYLSAKVKTMSNQLRNDVDVIKYGNYNEMLLNIHPFLLKKMEQNPLNLFPSKLRPHFTKAGDAIPQTTIIAGNGGFYSILDLPLPSTNMVLPSALYRAFDPIFGGVGRKPVMKVSQNLKVDEYVRLTLSGALCTVLVRTLLNPLELVKTKIQLQNDEDLMNYISTKSKEGNLNIDSTKAKSANSLRSDVVLEDKGQTKSISESKDKVTTNMAFAKGETKQDIGKKSALGTTEVIKALVDLRGPFSLFQSADITFLASLVFGSFGFGATELFRRSFTLMFFSEDSSLGKGGEELTLLFAAAIACILTSAAAAPFEIIRVRSMGYIDPKSWNLVLADFLNEKRIERESSNIPTSKTSKTIPPKYNGLKDLTKEDFKPLFLGFYPIVSRELPFAITKFLTFDVVASTLLAFINSQPRVIETVQVGVGPVGLTVSALSGAIAGIAGAFVSHPADLILTLTSSSKRKSSNNSTSSGTPNDDKEVNNSKNEKDANDWRPIVKELLSKEGGIANLFTGLPARASFFFLVIGLQFFLYDFAKTLFSVGTEDLKLVLDVFYAIRQGLVNMDVQ